MSGERDAEERRAAAVRDAQERARQSEPDPHAPATPTPVVELPEDAVDELRTDLADLLATQGPACLVAKYARPPEGTRRSIGARKFSDVEAAIAWVQLLLRHPQAAENPPSFYVVRNPSGTDLMVGKNERRRPVRAGDVGNPPSIPEIEALAWLALDVDPTGSLSPEQQAEVRARAVAALRSLGVPLHFVLDSGRGVQAQVRLAEPAEPTPDNHALYRACCLALYQRLSTRLLGVPCEIDTTVQNPNRQSRLVGTPNRKTGRVARFVERTGATVPTLAALAELVGASGNARPLVKVGDAVPAVGNADLDARVRELVAQGWEAPSEAQVALLRTAATAEPDVGALSAAGRQLVDAFGFPFPDGGSGGERPRRELALARQLLEEGEPIAGVLGFLGQPRRHCTSGDQGEPTRAVARAMAAAVLLADLAPPAADEMTAEEYATWHAGLGGAEDDDPPLVLGDNGAYPLSEDHLAQAFVNHHADDLTYCAELGQWFEWVGDRWQADTTHSVWNLIRPVVRQASLLAPKDSLALRIARAQTVVAVEKLARSDRRVARRAADYDRDLDLLNTPGGIVHLPSGELRPHDRAQLMTRATACAPAPPGTEPTRWLRTLGDWTGDDPATIAYLQQACGLMLSGRVHEHLLLFLWGKGGNGKTTFARVVSLVLGGYVEETPAATLTVQGSQHHPTDLASLRAARLVVANETEQDVGWAEARIKMMTGGDAIKARFMRQDFFTYTPQFTLLVVGNHRPSLRAVDAAIARRMHLIPFSRTIPDDQQEDGLVERLVAEEGPAILRWMVEGYLAWREAGRLVRPPAVREATSAYLSDEDHLGRWMAECTQPAPAESRCAMRDVYASWRDWCARNGVDRPGPQKALTAALKDRGHAITPFEGYPHLRGRVLRPEEVVRLETARAGRVDDVRAVGRALAAGAERVAAEPDAGVVEQDEALPF